MSLVSFCSECSQDRGFEQPLCADEHGADCPEWFCVECGYAVVVGSVYDETFDYSERAAA